MTIAKLLSHATPINKDAAMIIRPAKLEDTWMPKVNVPNHVSFSKNVLPVKPIPKSAFTCPSFKNPIGKRRGKIVVVGYAANQTESKRKPARWVVRCDCGNFEHRSKIIRWMTMDEDDHCMECHLREYKTKGEFFSRDQTIKSTNAKT